MKTIDFSSYMTLRALLLEVEEKHTLASFVRFASFRGIPSPSKSLDGLMAGLLVSAAGKPIIPLAKVDALLLAANDFNERMKEVDDEREVAFAEVTEAMARCTAHIGMEATVIRLYGLRNKFNLAPTAYSQRSLQRIKAGEWKRPKGIYENYLFSLEQALNLRDALMELERRLLAMLAAPPTVFVDLKAELSLNFDVRPIGRVTRRVALEGLEISERTVLNIRRGVHQQEGNHIISLRRAEKLLVILKKIGPMSGREEAK